MTGTGRSGSRSKPSSLREVLGSMSPWELARFRWAGVVNGVRVGEARETQIPPAEAAFWLYQAGRGAGKTRSAVEAAAEHCRVFKGARVALVGKTFGDARDVLVEGAGSGMLAILPPSVVRRWNRNMGELHLTTGGMMKCYGATAPDKLRGPQFSFAICDELAAWDGRDAWDNLLLALRHGPFPQAVITTTPTRTPLFRELAKDPRVVKVRESSYANLDNLAPSFKQQILDRYEGTSRGRQEIMGELLEDVEGAPWNQGELDSLRVVPKLVYPDGQVTGWWAQPQFWLRKVVGLDPADGLAEGDEQGLVLVGQSPEDEHFYVLRSEGYRLRPWDYLAEAVKIAHQEKASIVVEKNHGGQYLMTLLREVMGTTGMTVPVSGVSATQNKRDRALAVHGLYEQRRVHHVGYMPQLEDEMTTWTGLPGRREASPNRLDALVHALTQFTSWGVTRPGANAIPFSDQAVQYGAVRWADSPPDSFVPMRTDPFSGGELAPVPIRRPGR